MKTIKIKNKPLASRISSIALTLGISPAAVATGILYAHCMSAKEKKKAPATTATTATAQPEEKEEEKPRPSIQDAKAALAALRQQLKQS